MHHIRRYKIGMEPTHNMTAFGDVLKTWRTRRRQSQLDLGLAAGVSSRHISFLETGRAQPSRGMILRLCDTLDIPQSARNHLLFAAGMTPAYGARALSDAEMRPVRDAVDWIMARHAPYPALAMDRHWRLLAVNPPAGYMLNGFGVELGDSLIDHLATNEAIRASIENLQEVTAHLVTRLRTEITHFGGDPVLESAITALSPAPTPPWDDIGLLPAFVPTRYRFGGQILSLFSTYTQFGTAEDVALSELRIEMMFPADEQTRVMLEQFAAAAASEQKAE